jgi:hypothetical protein
MVAGHNHHLQTRISQVNLFQEMVELPLRTGRRISHIKHITGN